jgi:hypothetical protein
MIVAAANAPDRTFAVCDIHRATVTLDAIFFGHVVDYLLSEIDCLRIIEEFHETEFFDLGCAMMHGEAVHWHDEVRETGMKKMNKTTPFLTLLPDVMESLTLINANVGDCSKPASPVFKTSH